MAKPYPEEFRRDVIAVARRGEIPLTQVAKDFGISEGTVTNWLRRADIDDGIQSGPTTTENVELRELRKRNRLLEQENGTRSSAVPLRICPKRTSQNDVPAGP
ncbi:transposase [Curtobacterium sp. Csp2]|uniref:transposase n=1 Tax=Curtobacterium sp. Csp2 TaxID=2495430 RepID=UPI001580DFEC|nr:transposase [Curtobacterium sp. Csp2]